MQFIYRVKHIIIISCISIIVTLFLGFIFQNSIWSEFEKFFLFHGTTFQKESENIVIVRIDEKTINTLQNQDLRILNFQKSIFAQLIEIIEKDNAGTIGIDVIFWNESSESDKITLEKMLNSFNNIVIAGKIGIAPEYKNQSLPLDIYQKTTLWAVDTLLVWDSVTYYPPQSYYSWKLIDAFGIGIFKKWKNIVSTWSISEWEYRLTPVQKIPLEVWNIIRIPFFHTPLQYPSISMIDVLQKNFESWYFSGKIVLIGEYGTLLHDEFLTPVDRRIRMPWIEIHANIIDSLITQTHIHSIDGYLDIVLLLCMSIFMAWLIFSLWVWATIIIFIGSIIGIIFWWKLLLFWYEIYIHIFQYIINIVTVFIIAYMYRYVVLDKNRRYLKNVFSKYVSPELVKEIEKHPEKVWIWWEKRHLAIFFSDIEWFTTISEKLLPEELTKVMNEYLNAMTDVLVKQWWTLDMYIGDAVMGFFGAPILLDRVEHRACETALAQLKILKDLNLEWSKTDIPHISILIWIASGDVIVGNFWSWVRFDYTVFWDRVNLASRLEGINKYYGTQICVSEHIFQKVSQDFYCRELDTIRVKWKNEWVKIYELIGKMTDIHNTSTYDIYTNALEVYYAWDYSSAIEILSKNLQDKPSQNLTLRCKQILRSEITVIDGIFDMKGK